MNVRRFLYKNFKAPLVNKLISPKMTIDAVEFLQDYSRKLHLELHSGLDFIKGLSESLSMKEYLIIISPFIDQISMRQEKTLHYLPIHAMIYFITKKLSPVLAVETGVEKGGSTSMILEAMNENNFGHLYSIDIGKYYVYKRKPVCDVAPLVNDDLKDRWTFICGDAQKKLPKLFDSIKGSINLFMAGHSHTYEIQKQEGELAWKKLASGGIFILDRADFNDNKYLNEFMNDHHDQVDFIKTYKEGRFADTLEFTVILKK